MDADHTRLEELYREYLACCNERRFEELVDFVAPGVGVNDEKIGIRRYTERLQEITRAFPDFHWEVEHLVVEEGWVSAHLRDTGMAPDGRRVRIQEFALYRFASGRITTVWGDLDLARLGSVAEPRP